MATVAETKQKKFDFEGRESEGVRAVELAGEWFHVDGNDQPIYSERFDNVGPMCMGRASARKDGKEWHIRREGKDAYAERHDYAGNFVRGADGKWTASVRDGVESYEIGLDGSRVAPVA